ncbi:MAG: V-type ATPase 116kDa subunit family protein [Desulfurococcaceae archaeon]
MILLNRPEEMVEITVAFLKEDKERAIEVLQRAGVVDLEHVEPGEVLSRYAKLGELHSKISSLISRAKGKALRAELTAYEMEALSLERIEAEVEGLQARLERLERSAAEARSRASRLLAAIEALSALPGELGAEYAFFRGQRVSAVAVSGKREDVEKLALSRGATSVACGGAEIATCVLLVPSDELGPLISEARSLGLWHGDEELGEAAKACKTLAELVAELKRRLSEAEAEASRAEAEARSLVEGALPVLGKYLLYVENLLERYRVYGSLAEARRLAAAKGWIPASKLGELVDALKSSGTSFAIETRKPERGRDSPPTMFRNPPLIRNYQLVTRMYGVPNYWEPDPTPVIAYSFALFFGIMNADVGYALAGILALLFLLDRFVEDPKSPGYLEFKKFMLTNNVSALVFGFLSGSLFGDLLPTLFGVSVPVILEPMASPVGFIVLALLIGLAHVNLAHALALRKFVGEGRFGEALNEAGLLALEVFGIPLVLKVFLSLNVPPFSFMPGDALLVGVIASLAVLVAGNYLMMRGLGLMMWIFQVTGVMGDVMSYARLAGVGMATYYMASSFNLMARLAFVGLNALAWPLGYVAGAAIAGIILVAANLLISALAQLGAFVHSLRLCMLEFLTKFYDGSGREYSPLRIVSSKLISVPR